METKRNNLIKFVTYLALFLLVGLSLSAAASEFTVMDALNNPVISNQSMEVENTYHPFWLLFTVLIGYVVMSKRKGI